MIELTSAKLRVAEAIRAGAATVEDISGAIGVGRERVKRYLAAIGDALGISRLGGRRHCDRPRVIAAIRAADGFAQQAPAVGDSRNVFQRDSMPQRAPREWPAYYGGVHDMGDRI